MKAALACGTDDCGTVADSDLRRERSDSAGRTMDEDRVPVGDPVAVSRWMAVVPVSIMAAAVSQLRPGGLGTIVEAGTVMKSAYPPRMRYAITSSPTLP